MSLQDIKSYYELELNDEKLKIEFDFNSIGVVEMITCKGIFKIKELIEAGNLGTLDILNIFCAGLTKHHKEETIQKIREFLQKNIYLFPALTNHLTFPLFRPLYPPEVYNEVFSKVKNESNVEVKEEAKKSQKKHPKQ